MDVGGQAQKADDDEELLSAACAKNVAGNAGSSAGALEVSEEATTAGSRSGGTVSLEGTLDSSGGDALRKAMPESPNSVSAPFETTFGTGTTVSNEFTFGSTRMVGMPPPSLLPKASTASAFLDATAAAAGRAPAPAPCRALSPTPRGRGATRSPRRGGDGDDGEADFTFGTTAPIHLPDFSKVSEAEPLANEGRQTLLRRAGAGDSDFNWTTPRRLQERMQTLQIHHRQRQQLQQQQHQQQQHHHHHMQAAMEASLPRAIPGPSPNEAAAASEAGVWSPYGDQLSQQHFAMLQAQAFPTHIPHGFVSPEARSASSWSWSQGTPPGAVQCDPAPRGDAPVEEEDAHQRSSEELSEGDNDEELAVDPASYGPYFPTKPNPKQAPGGVTLAVTCTPQRARRCAACCCIFVIILALGAVAVFFYEDRGIIGVDSP